MSRKSSMLVVCLMLGISSSAFAAGRGFLGVEVAESDGSVIIVDFIRNTPAWRLYRAGVVDQNDTIVRLAGKRVESVRDLTEARDSIPKGMEGRMVLEDRSGRRYFVWVQPAQVSGAKTVDGQPVSEQPARWSKGGSGEGEGKHFRSADNNEGGVPEEERPSSEGDVRPPTP